MTVLGGEDVRDGRFYRLDDDPAAKTFPELKAAVLARKAAETRKTALWLLFPEQHAPARDHPAVIQLDRWAEQNGLDVVRPAKP